MSVVIVGMPAWAAMAADSTVKPLTFSVERGLYDQPFQLQLASGISNAVIRFTTDGSLPGATNGQTYSGSLTVAHTTCLRAAAFSPGMTSLVVQTHTYIFPEDVRHQPAQPPGFPITTTWSTYGIPSQYGIVGQIVADPQYGPLLRSALEALPSLSVVLNIDDMFGAQNGLYTHAGDAGLEAPCSVELINPDGSGGFQIDAAIKMHGGGSRLRTMKHPFRLRFKSAYGADKLRYRFFPDSPVTEFDTIDLRADYNNHWTHGFDPNQRARGTLIRDAWCKDVLAAMGGFSSHSRYVHLYIDGLYWGIYNPCERPDGSFAASYFGGKAEDYDAINGTAPDPPVNGDAVARNAMLALGNLVDPAQYTQMQGDLNVRQYIDYLLVQWYGANQDWGTTKNWYAFRQRQPGAGFFYVAWDSERVMEAINDNVLSVSPDALQAKLAANAEYRLLFADRVHKHLFNDGAMTTNGLMQTWMRRAAQIDTAIIAESARWGASMPKPALSPLPYPSYKAGTPYVRNSDWIGEQGRLLTNYFPNRGQVFLNQLRAAGLYPSLAAPELNQQGGWVPAGFNVVLSNTASSGTVYYTMDGTDPRVPISGAVSGRARAWSEASPAVLTESAVVKARVRDTAGNWSALTEAEFQVAQRGVPVRITELMNHPQGGDAFEFIELQNTGRTPVDLSGASFDGIDFIFPYGTVVAPGAIIVLAHDTDPAAFQVRYPGVQVLGYYKKHLAKEGERVALLDRSGQTIASVTYSNAAPWPVLTDESGRSLELIDTQGDQTAPANWQVSAGPFGSPGQATTPAPVPVVTFNELMAANTGVVSNAWGAYDWLELRNNSAAPVGLAGWSIMREGGQAPFTFPQGVVVNAGDYLVAWCDKLVGFPGLHTGFGLERQGGTLALYDATTNRVDTVSYGPQVSDYSIGPTTPGSKIWQLTRPTPGLPNEPLVTPDSRSLVLNEWMAHPLPGGADWIELFNTSDSTAALTGAYLGTSHAMFRIGTPGFVAPKGHVRLWADEQPGGNHLDFKLPAAGGEIDLYDSTGRLLDRGTYPTQAEGTSEGRLPDGAAVIVQFPDTPTPGSANTLTLSPKLLVSLGGMSADGFHFQISGQTGAQYAIESSVDLVHWTTLSNLVAVGPVSEYTDAVTAASVTRFYRVVLQSSP
jgi:hypothetical protein